MGLSTTEIIMICIFLYLIVSKIMEAIVSGKKDCPVERDIGLEKRFESLELSVVEIKESLKNIESNIKSLRIQKAAKEAAPYYENEQLQEENEMLKAELEKLRAAIGHGSKSADNANEGDGSHEQ